MNNSFKAAVLLIFAILYSIDSDAKKPKWIKERPILNDYYQGIGAVEKDGSQIDYKLSARSKALKELSSEITVTISANSILHQLENNNLVKESYESNTSLKTMQTLEGYEIETYEDSKNYWVYAKLSKAKYEMAKRQKLEKVKKLALINYQKGLNSQKEGDVNEAIANYLKTITALKDHLDEDLTIKSFDGDINLGSDTYTNLQHILQNIHFEPFQTNISVKLSRDLEIPIAVTATYKTGAIDKHPISNLPISFSFTKGEGDLCASSTTNYEGEAKCGISKVTSNIKRQQIRARLNIEPFLDSDATVANIQKAFVPIELLPETTISLEMQRSKAVIELKESSFCDRTNGKYLANELRSILNQNFFTYTDSINNSDFTIKLSVNFTDGGSKPSNGYTVYIVYGEIDMTVISNNTMEEIFSHRSSQIKGMKSGSYENALKDAASKCLKTFEKELIPELEQLEM